MGTGGTIPKQITQTVTFYNTTGVIEKDKLIYLAPRFKNVTGALGKQVRDAYISALEGMCPPSSAFKDYPIATWSPQDRSLSVRANIDDFRLVTDEGECLNYLIVTRTVVKTINNVDTSETFYYGFFITDVTQSGGATVELTLEPDDFTNVFYLHNKTVLNSDLLLNTYEPFNERMKNCYVKRQHYDRVILAGIYYLMTVELRDINANPYFNDGDAVIIDFADSGQGTQISGTVEYFDDRDFEENKHIRLVVRTASKVDIGEPENYSTLLYNNQQYSFDYEQDEISWERKGNYIPVNNQIFLNQDESFKFKYQYRDKKVPLSLGSIFTDSELTLIKNTNIFGNLSVDLRKKILKACMQYLVIELKSTEKSGYVTMQGSNPGVWNVGYKRIYSNYVGDIKRTSPLYFVPFMNVPQLFSKYASEIEKFTQVEGYFTEFSGTSLYTMSASLIYNWINSDAFADFVYDAYIVSDIGLPADKVDFNLTNHHIYITCIGSPYNNDKDTKGAFYVSLFKPDAEMTSGDGIIYIYNDSLTELHGVSQNNCVAVFMLTGYDSRNITLNITDVIPDLKNNFYENVLEAEPYSFYSLSYLTYEMPLNKNRYYETMSIDIQYYVSINGALKVEIIPAYQVESNKYLYYNEALVFTLPSSLPLVSDSYSSYYYQNKAQMKNQFAINDYNKGVDLAQHFFLSGPNKVGNQAFKKGGWGAIAETVYQFGEMADELVDWAQSTKNIEMNQKAKLADMGAKPDVVKQTGSDVFADILTGENRLYVNHYRIDSLSYNALAKFLERFGYQVSLYTSINALNRVGWNYVQLNSFDFNPAYDIMNSQEDNLRKLFSQGITLLHDKSFLTSGHNYETILED